MKAVIIDDQKKKISNLKATLAKHCADVRIIGEATDAEEGITLINERQPDLVFLDIQMPGKSGFDMLAELGHYEFEVIFVTAYDQFGIQAVKFSALDYLLKPVNALELIKAVTKAKLKTSRKITEKQIHNLLANLHAPNKDDHRIVLPFMKEFRYLTPDEIIRCESLGSYTQFILSDGEKLTVSRLINEYERMLSPYGFIRCHQSHLVNRIFIKSMTKDDNISELILKGGTKIPVSRLKREMVKAVFES